MENLMKLARLQSEGYAIMIKSYPIHISLDCDSKWEDKPSYVTIDIWECPNKKPTDWDHPLLSVTGDTMETTAEKAVRKLDKIASSFARPKEEDIIRA